MGCRKSRTVQNKMNSLAKLKLMRVLIASKHIASYHELDCFLADVRDMQSEEELEEYRRKFIRPWQFNYVIACAALFCIVMYCL